MLEPGCIIGLTVFEKALVFVADNALLLVAEGLATQIGLLVRTDAVVNKDGIGETVRVFKGRWEDTYPIGAIVRGEAWGTLANVAVKVPRTLRRTPFVGLARSLAVLEARLLPPLARTLAAGLSLLLLL